MPDQEQQNAALFHADADDVFGRIANRYDLMCDVFSLGSHRGWKHGLALRMSEESGEVVVDLAAGTGHIIHRLARRLARSPPAEKKQLRAIDLSPAMLAVAQRKGDLEGLKIQYEIMNAYELTGVADASVDILSIAFGMKIMDRSKVMTEVARVLRTGGIFFCLEAAQIPVPFLHRLYLGYMGICMPLMARIVMGGDPSAYDYLLRGINGFPDQHHLAREFESFGFRDVTFQNMSLGIVALHRAVRHR